MSRMKGYKFIVRDNFVVVPSTPALSYNKCVAACIAENEDAARALLIRYAAENGRDGRWLEKGCAEVIEFPDLDNPAVLAWARS